MTDGLYFCSASFGGFGVARVGADVPESHLLFLCPPSCGRHTSLSSISLGYRGRVSYLFLEEYEISAGMTEDALYDGVESVLERLPIRPKAILIYFCCSLYMSGADETGILEELRRRNEDIVFQICRMNPIVAGSGPTPAQTIHSRIYGLVDLDGKEDRRVNLIGSDYPLDGGCELPAVLKRCGWEGPDHISQKNSFGSFRKMGSAGLNLVIHPDGRLAAEDMSPKIPFVFLPVSYDMDEIGDQYSKLFSAIGSETDLSEYVAETQKEIDRTKMAVGDRTVAVSTSSACAPWGLVKALIKYGFNVESVFGESSAPYDAEAKRWVLENAPHIREIDTENADMLKAVGICGSPDISVGFNAAYFTKTGAVAPLVCDEGVFGYYAVNKLMKMLAESIDSEKDLETAMDEYGLVL
ncbi:MAG: nitrogenase component 1 [Candidatus Methanoplasma sp.]|jgi:nitrogenase molybdenum-iron protein alpha/beta subunit|nr:nitrogenase component 1 [Candidatus Methanoplasma sp.]